LVDMALYSAEGNPIGDIEGFERETLKDLGMPDEIVMRHRIPHFMHIMSGYAAGCYSHLWSEVMDGDAFAAFEETGDVCHRAPTPKLYAFHYPAAIRSEPHLAYVALRGRPPKIHRLLKNRRLAASTLSTSQTLTRHGRTRRPGRKRKQR